ncbi:Hypothetical protein R9X50_00646800 [Acrodontium crateriforme]|uniref:Uncharacterized protein n=1 Tax=Acrodontium crateriforme TaxID=150365 RepID=A0AAQ3RBK7_9PEZI|nr:Hypothetical protein R9X50_00646800 [Acrodontium crateriforme]
MRQISEPRRSDAPLMGGRKLNLESAGIGGIPADDRRLTATYTETLGGTPRFSTVTVVVADSFKSDATAKELSIPIQIDPTSTTGGGTGTVVPNPIPNPNPNPAPGPKPTPSTGTGGTSAFGIKPVIPVTTWPGPQSTTLPTFPVRLDPSAKILDQVTLLMAQGRQTIRVTAPMPESKTFSYQVEGRAEDDVVRAWRSGVVNGMFYWDITWWRLDAGWGPAKNGVFTVTTITTPLASPNGPFTTVVQPYLLKMLVDQFDPNA